jgi:hypothetical protein
LAAFSYTITEIRPIFLELRYLCSVLSGLGLEKPLSRKYPTRKIENPEENASKITLNSSNFVENDIFPHFMDSLSIFVQTAPQTVHD